MDTIDYKTTFEQSPSLVIMMDLDFTILTASDAYLKATQTVREDIVGHNLFVIFPDNPTDNSADGVSNIRASLNRIIKTKTAEKIAVVKYDIPRPESEGGGFMVKYWQPIHTPVLDEFNEVKYVLQYVLDVTENETLVAQLALEKKLLQQVSESEKRYSLLLMKSPFAIAVLKGKEMFITLANDKIKKIWGKGNDVEGKKLLDVLPELRTTEFPSLLNEVYTTCTPFYGDELLYRSQQKHNEDETYFNFIYQPYLEADETISGVTVLVYEVTEMIVARKKVEESKLRFQCAVEALQGFLWTNNAAGQMEGNQPSWTLLTGQKKEDYQGYGWADAIHPEDKEPTLQAWHTALITKEKFVFEHRLKMSDGNWGQFSINAIPLFNPDGSVLEWVGVHTNISKQRRAEKDFKESEQKFRSMMETIPQIAWTNTVDLEVNFFNQRWYDYTGLDFNESQQSGWKKVIHPDDLRDTFHQFNTILKTMKRGEFQTRLQASNKQYRWHLIQLKAIKDEKGKMQLWVGTATDIQELRLLQQQKDDFISIASHELKTPVTTLKLSLQLLNELKEGLSPPLIADLITQANRSLDRFTVLIDDLLDASKVNDGQLHLNRKLIILSHTIGDWCSNVKLEGQHILKFEGDMEVKVIADADRIIQVMVNLVNNAIKYAPDSKVIKIIIEKVNGFVKVSVADKGPGIQPEKIPYLFQRYYQVESKGTKYSTGLGLGLYIAAEIIKRHKGQIGVESEVGKGSTFWFTLPL